MSTLSLLVVVLLAVFVLYGSGAIITVNAVNWNFGTILNGANILAGDTFNIQAGVYSVNGTKLIPRVNVTIEGYQAIIDCADRSALGATTRTKVIIRGITFRRCYRALETATSSEHIIEDASFNNNVESIRTNAASLSINNCTFTYNEASMISDGSTIIISNSRFMHNYISNNHGSCLRISSQGNYIIRDSYFFNNTAASGGVIYIEDNLAGARKVNLEIIGSEFRNNTAQVTGGIMRVFTARSLAVNISNCLFINNVAGSLSGCFQFAEQYYPVIITDSNFTSNSGPGGSAIRCLRGDTTIKNCHFTSQSSSPAVHVTGSTGKLSISSSSFTYNSHSAVQTGDDATFEIKDSLFAYNGGSGLLMLSGSQQVDRIVRGSTFINNTDGAIMLRSVNGLTVLSSFISSNFRDDGGGGLRLEGTSNVLVESTTFQNNSSPHGGAVATNSLGTNVVFRNCTFLKNKATRGAGGAINGGRDISVEGCRFQENQATTLGGAVRGIASITNSDFDSNEAPSGGAIQCGANTTILSSNFLYNVATLGGALHCNQTLIVVNSTFSNNTATRGGGIYGYGGSSNIFSSTIRFNTAYYGGGYYMENGAFILFDVDHSNFEQNTADYQGGGMLLMSTSGIVYNSFVTYNEVLQQGEGEFINGTGGGIIIGGDKMVEIQQSFIQYNSAPRNGSGVSIHASVKTRHLVIDSTITENTGSIYENGIFLSALADLVMRSTVLQTSSRVHSFCCGGTGTSNPASVLCSYPVCDESSCRGTTGCQCPFATPLVIPPNSPILPFSNTSCTCAFGFVGPQCQTNACGPCNVNTTCVQLSEIQYTCTCRAGFSGNPCLDVDECRAGTATCPTNANCVNTLGSYYCVCKDGYNGTNCNDINECTDGSHNCSSNGYCENNSGSFSCHCNDGFEGNGYTCTDINECSRTNNCSANANCTNTFGGFFCTCNPGYDGNGFSCSDINECTGINNCSVYANCSNTAPFFTCACKDGYEGNGFNCTDINECNRGHSCTQNATCINFDGGVNCTCLPGYFGDGDICTETDFCIGNNCSANADCFNSHGSFRCDCSTGYEGNGYICTDINECTRGYCSEHADCQNFNGSYSCDCIFGYTGNGVTCTDVNECNVPSHNCSTNANCTNIPGDFLCYCKPGYQGDGFDCTDIDECEVGGYCSDDASCQNSDGNFTCTCLPGYYGDGFTCNDTNECTGINYCSSDANCTNIPGEFLCHCKPGYQGDGYDCTDIDECEERGYCSDDAECQNSDGNFTCTCSPGYYGDGFNCTDINECSGINNCSTNANCTNTIGDFACQCKAGFYGDGYNCTDINECTEENICGGNAKCDNTEGSHNCTCLPGYFGDGLICTETDFCVDNNCSTNANCRNAYGSFVCDCFSGYPGNGFNCTDVNECNGVNDCDENAECHNNEGSYTCTCLYGYTGNGTVCIDINECTEIDKCGANAKCNNNNGSYSCDCLPGYSGDGLNCTDIDECEMEQRGCDVHVTCNNTEGNRSCGECPTGYTGSGYSFCSPLCGDSQCDSSIGENCVTCFSDCNSTSCNTCGDGVCDDTETCSSCFQDCSTRCSTVCPRCSEHGTCINGVCVCRDPWTGDTCDAQREPIIIEVNSTKPSVEIKPDPNSVPPSLSSLKFDLSLKALTERDQNNDVVKTINLDSELNFTRIHSPMFNNTSNVMWLYSASLPNGAKIIITNQKERKYVLFDGRKFIQFNEKTDYYYLNETMELAANTFKFNFLIQNWPFMSIRNHLDVEMMNELKNDNSDCLPSSERGEMEGFLQWWKITMNSVTVYAQFVPESFIDGRMRIIKFYVLRESVIAATIPHFWQSAEFDPVYSLLYLAPGENENEKFDECGNLLISEKEDGDDIGMIVGIVVGVVVGVALLAAAAISYTLYRRKRRTAKLMNFNQNIKKDKKNAGEPNSSPLYNNNEKENPLFSQSSNDL